VAQLYMMLDGLSSRYNCGQRTAVASMPCFWANQAALQMQVQTKVNFFALCSLKDLEFFDCRRIVCNSMICIALGLCHGRVKTTRTKVGFSDSDLEICCYIFTQVANVGH